MRGAATVSTAAPEPSTVSYTTFLALPVGGAVSALRPHARDAQLRVTARGCSRAAQHAAWLSRFRRGAAPGTGRAYRDRLAPRWSELRLERWISVGTALPPYGARERDSRQKSLQRAAAGVKAARHTKSRWRRGRRQRNTLRGNKPIVIVGIAVNCRGSPAGAARRGRPYGAAAPCTQALSFFVFSGA